jgi:hypothetical protein
MQGRIQGLGPHYALVVVLACGRLWLVPHHPLHVLYVILVSGQVRHRLRALLVLLGRFRQHRGHHLVQTVRYAMLVPTLLRRLLRV